jgi:cation diffusion facilitator CzcD-associated flavoprotein CzcO
MADWDTAKTGPTGKILAPEIETRNILLCEMASHIPLLIIGAGPYGLAVATYARQKGIEHVVLGKPMDFWTSNMPKGMYLRSGRDWHYDPFDQDTIDSYLKTKNLAPEEVEPLPLDFYLGYVEWFVEQKGLKVRPAWVEKLSHVADGSPPYFEVTLQDGEKLTATNVVLALGFRYFKNIPEAYSTLFPAERFAHTCELINLAPLKSKRVLIIGGRQSAFEWAALLNEQGAASVSLSYRHPTPAFAQADWSWVNPIVDAMVENPAWYRRLTDEEQKQIDRRLWAEGRLKLEPWLAPRIATEAIKLFPQTLVVGCKELPNHDLEVSLDSATVVVDQIILATGYRVKLPQVPFLTPGNILMQLETRNGFPTLDEHFQSNIAGLFFTSMCATQDFGPFFAFTAGIRTSANLIGSALRA